jgi:hypothetical protein
MEKTTLNQRTALVQQGEGIVTIKTGNVPVLRHNSFAESVPLICNFLRSGSAVVQLLVTITMSSGAEEDLHKAEMEMFVTRLSTYLNTFIVSDEVFTVRDSCIIETFDQDFASNWMVEVENESHEV